MFTFPDPKTNNPQNRKTQRILEIIPGSLTWATLIGMPFLSFLLPIWVAIFVIAFDIYWICRIIFISFYSVSAYRKLQKGKNIDWWERCQNIADPKKYANSLLERIEKMKKSPRNGLSFQEKRKIRKEIKYLKKYREEVKKLEKISDQIWDWRKITHVVLLPTAGESAEIIEPAIQAVAIAIFPTGKLLFF